MRVHTQNALAGCRSILLQEMIDQQRDVFATLAQRRHRDRNHAQAVVQVFAESIFGHLLVEIAVGGRDHAHVDGNLGRAAHRPNAALLQYTQQFDLHGQRHFADFVEKDRALVGHFEQATLVLVGSGERAFYVTEQFAFQQSLGKGSAIDGDEGFAGPR